MKKKDEELRLQLPLLVSSCIESLNFLEVLHIEEDNIRIRYLQMNRFLRIPKNQSRF